MVVGWLVAVRGGAERLRGVGDIDGGGGGRERGVDLAARRLHVCGDVVCVVGYFDVCVRVR